MSKMIESVTIPPAAYTRDWRWDGRRVVVMGLGSFGGTVGAIRWLAGNGADVLVTDLAGPEKLASSVRQIADLSVRMRLGGHDPGDLAETDVLVVSPAVDKRKSSFFQQAVERGIPWTSEMNLFLERCAARLVAVTGTAGKSTVCAMVHTICQDAVDRGDAPFRRCFLGGNIGGSLLQTCEEMNAYDLVVLELSSFQLEDAADLPWRPEITVLTNVLPHHLDRHGTFEHYRDAKLNLLRVRYDTTSIDPTKFSVICATDEPDIVMRVRELASMRGGAVFSAARPTRRYSLRIPGAHNQVNAECAATVGRLLRISPERIDASLSAFPGLPHRLQFVRRLREVDYYNDSKATTPQAAATAVRSFDRPLVVIVGGQESPGEDRREFMELLLARARAVIAMGKASSAWVEEQAQMPWSGPRPESLQASNLAEATALAFQHSRPGDVVLLAPAAASYDQFRNYEERGATFARYVNDLSA